MSNVDRPRTGMKACPFDGSTVRDSNGQCACRNALYRLSKKAAPSQRDRVKSTFNGVLKSGDDVAQATAAVVEKFPSLKPQPRKAPAAKKAPAKKSAAKKATTGQKAAKASTPAAKKAAPAKAAKIVDEAKAAVQEKAAEEKVEPARYILHIEDGFTDPYPYARKDAAIKNGVRSGSEWRVEYKGKVVANSEA